MVIFSIVSACVVRVIKEKAVTMRKTGAGIIAVIFAAFGLGAMQVCGIGAPVCGATVGAGLFSLFFPALFASFLDEHALSLIILSIVIEIIALYYLKCFRGYHRVR